MYVAGGNFDAFVHLGGSDIQEVAAGVLLVREGGGVVTGLAGEEDVGGARTIVAGTADAYRRVLAALRGL